MKVVASFSILDNLVRQIGGEYVQVTSLVGPNGDAHTYQPSPSDARHLAKAQLVVVNGLGFEGWLERLIKASGYSGKIVQASDEIPVVLDGEDTEESHGDHHHGAHDPHAWQNLANGKAYVENIARALAQIDAPHAQFYLKRSEEMAQDLEFLDKWVRSRSPLFQSPKGLSSPRTMHSDISPMPMACSLRPRGCQYRSRAQREGIGQVDPANP